MGSGTLPNLGGTSQKNHPVYIPTYPCNRSDSSDISDSSDSSKSDIQKMWEIVTFVKGFVNMWILEYQMETKTILKPTYLLTYWQ